MKGIALSLMLVFHCPELAIIDSFSLLLIKKKLLISRILLKNYRMYIGGKQRC